MKEFHIRSLNNNDILFQGVFRSFKNCLEEAVRQEILLLQADLRHKNLSNANLDNACLKGADFTHSNLSGANLSECDLRQCCFINSALYNSCMAYSDLQNCNFEGAGFGATDITGANISGSLFSTLSCFSLDFIEAEAMDNCGFKTIDGSIKPMSKPPIVIKGLRSTPLVFIDHAVRTDHIFRRIMG